MNRLTIRLLTGLLVLLALISIGVALKSSQELPNAGSQPAQVIELESYKFQKGRFRYERRSRLMARVIAQILPESETKKIKWLKPECEIAFRSSIPDEPYLFAAFSTRDAKGLLQGVGTRVVVLDDRGQSFDYVINDNSADGAFELEAFPRRGTELHLRLMDFKKSIAEFTIPNPCPGPHPVWKAAQVPLQVTNAALEITLERFVADAARRRTWCAFRVRENGEESSNWRPREFEISDATGNHWRPEIDPSPPAVKGCVTGGFYGALWPDEDAWKLRVEFDPMDKDSTNRTKCSVEFLVKPEQADGVRVPAE